jgi:hypothetical protein
VAQRDVAEGLQQDRAGRVHAQLLALEVDAPVALVGDGPDGARQVLDVAQGVAEVVDQRHEHALGEGARPVADVVEGLARHLLDLAEVVAPVVHLAPQLGVGEPGLLRRGGGLGPRALELLVQPEQVLEDVVGQPLRRLQVGQSEALVDRVALGLLQSDLQLRAPRGGLSLQKFLDRHTQGGRQCLEQ